MTRRVRRPRLGVPQLIVLGVLTSLMGGLVLWTVASDVLSPSTVAIDEPARAAQITRLRFALVDLDALPTPAGATSHAATLDEGCELGDRATSSAPSVSRHWSVPDGPTLDAA